MIKIGDFSKLSKISIRMLRHYDDIGLLAPIRVDEFTSYRYYSAEQLSTANTIQALKDMGFSLSVIKDILTAYGDNDSLRNYLKVQHSQMKQEAEMMEKRLLLLENALKTMGEDKNFMKHIVNVKEIPQRYVASLRKVIPAYKDEGQLWEQLYKETDSQNLQMANPCHPIAIFHDTEHKESDVEVEVQVSVTGTYTDTENVHFITAPSVIAASSVAKGNYEQLPAVYEAIAAWVTDNNYSFDGAIFNIYHVSPADDSNPENWVTEVCYPVKKK